MNNLIGRITAHAPALVLAAAVGVLGAALAMQYLAGLAPCRLCIAQRWPYVAVIVLAGIAMVPAVPDAWRRAWARSGPGGPMPGGNPGTSRGLSPISIGPSRFHPATSPPGAGEDAPGW